MLGKKVFPQARYEDYRRALCLLDPYGIDVSWEVVQVAGRMKSIEIFLNFMVMDMNMNVLLNNPEDAKPKQLERMNRFWGDETWRDAVYKPNPQTNFFDETETIKVADGNERISEAYRRRLLDVAGFKFAPPPLPFPNTTGAVVYYLFFASPDPTANKIVQQIFDKYRQKKWA